MSKFIGEPVKVHVRERDSVLTAFIWRKRLYRVNQVLGWWREPDEWWHGKAVRFLYESRRQEPAWGLMSFIGLVSSGSSAELSTRLSLWILFTFTSIPHIAFSMEPLPWIVF
jgi:hypothetical protein